MKLSFGDWFLIMFNLTYILGFGIYYFTSLNYEFLAYVGVLVIILGVIIYAQRTLRLPKYVLWLLSIWGLLHMLGGGVVLNGEVLYRFHIVDIYQGELEEFFILKYDQVLHFYVYFIMSLVFVHLLRPRFARGTHLGWLYVIATLSSMGLSIVNELIEFSAVVFLGQTGVGGYYNTLLDLLFNTFGAIVGSFIAYLHNK